MDLLVAVSMHSLRTTLEEAGASDRKVVYSKEDTLPTLFPNIDCHEG
jgi:hypothetical protein